MKPTNKDLIQAILNPELGYLYYPQFLSTEEVDTYRNECTSFLETGPKIYARINTPNIFDYVHPRSVLEDGADYLPRQRGETSNTYRIYQFFHNRHSKNTQNIFDKTLAIRQSIESSWFADPQYKKEQDRLQNYVIVTRYTFDRAGLPKHKDYSGPAPFPLLQCLILLSEPGTDYEGGEFILYTKSGKAVRLQEDLHIKKGDALFFDKSLIHEVEPTRTAAGNSIGRWSVLIGARACYKTRSTQYYRLRYSSLAIEILAPLWRKIKTSVRSMTRSRPNFFV